MPLIMTEALRVTFDFDEDRIALRSVRRVDMRVPRGTGPRSKGATGQCVELRGADGEVLYRRAGDVIPRMVEYPTGNSDRPLDRVRAPRRGTASVLVPVDERARSVAIVEARRTPTKGKQRAKVAAADLVTVDLEADYYEPRGS